MYRDLVSLYLKKIKTDAFTQEEEKDDIEELKEITDSEKFKKTMKDHLRFDALVRRVEMLVKQYDDLSKAEAENLEI